MERIPESCREYNKIIPYVERIMHNTGMILSAQLNITNKCYSKCKSCRKYEWPDVKLELSDVIRILDVLKEMSCESIVLSGGEPLAHNNFAEIVGEILKRQMKYCVLTSALTKHNINLELIASTADKIQVSIDAHNANLFEEIRGVDAFDRVCANVQEMVEIREITSLEKIRINCTLSKTNAKYIKEMYQLAVVLGCDINYYPVHTWPELMLDNNDWKVVELAKNEYKKIKDTADKVGFNFDIKTNMLYLQRLDEFKGNVCIIKDIHCVIDADGSVYPCCRLLNDNGDYDTEQENAYGNIKKQDPFKIFYGLLRKRVNSKIPHLEICKSCDRYRSINEAFEKYYKNRKRLFL
jgi:radical SAM protein with 4Fe4S-binding SPASM domain